MSVKYNVTRDPTETIIEDSKHKQTYAQPRKADTFSSKRLHARSKRQRSFFPQPTKLVESESRDVSEVNRILSEFTNPGSASSNWKSNKPIIIGFNPYDPDRTPEEIDITLDVPAGTSKVCDVIIIGNCGDGGGGAGGSAGGRGGLPENQGYNNGVPDDQFPVTYGGDGGKGGGAGGNGGLGGYKFLRNVPCDPSYPIRAYVKAANTGIGGEGGAGATTTVTASKGIAAIDASSTSNLFICNGNVYSASCGTPGAGGDIDATLGMANTEGYGYVGRARGKLTFNKTVTLRRRLVDLSTGDETTQDKVITLPSITTNMPIASEDLNWAGDVFVSGNAPPGTEFIDEINYIWVYRGVRARCAAYQRAKMFGCIGGYGGYPSLIEIRQFTTSTAIRLGLVEGDDKKTYDAYLKIVVPELDEFDIKFADSEDEEMPPEDPYNPIRPPQYNEPVRANVGDQYGVFDKRYQLRPKKLQLNAPYVNPSRNKTYSWADDSAALGIPEDGDYDYATDKRIMIIRMQLPSQVPGVGGPGGNGGAGGFGTITMPPSWWVTNPTPWQWGSGVWTGLPSQNPRTSGPSTDPTGEGNQIKGQDGSAGSQGAIFMLNWREV